MAPQPYEDAERVIRKFAEVAIAQVIDVRRAYEWERVSSDSQGQEIRITSHHGIIEERIPLLGLHQIENAATAIACCDALNDRWDGEYDRELFGCGLESVRWPGRIEVIHERPLVICDGAHNRDSARRLRETLVDYFACDRALFVIGCSSDKDIDGLAEELAPLASRVFTVRSNHPRAMAPERITEAFGRLNIDTEIGDSVGAAVDKAIAVGGESALICVAGSLFVAAEAREHFGLTTA
jgi:dihydrofolate synthase/folylpolyglutamate synthase